MKRILAALALLLAPAAHAQTLTQFRDEVAAAIRAERPGGCLLIDGPSTMRLGPSAADCASTLDVGNTYTEVITGRARKDEMIARLARLAITSPATTPVTGDRARLVVVLRPQAYIDSVPAAAQADIVRRPFAGDLFAVLMLDSADALQTASRASVASMGLDEAGAFALAAENLRARMGPLAREKLLRSIESVDAASALATGGLWLPEACKADTGVRLALVTMRNGYIALDNPDAGARAEFVEVARALIERGALSRTPIVCTGGVWRVLE